MHSFRYVQGRLHCESVDLETLAAQHGTPLYVYSKETITDHFTRLDSSLDTLDHLICYAVKANSNLAILNTIAELGGGFDIVSGGELFRVLQAGGKAQPGMLAALRNIRLHVDRADAIEGPLAITADRRLLQTDGSLYDFEVRGAGRLLCEGRIAIAAA